MSHLSLETIARLVEDEPDGIESAHLASCAGCRAQLDAMNEDVHALAMLPDMAAAPDQWDALERRLTDEGLIRTRSHRFMSRSTGMMQIAAALMLFIGGAVAGRMTAQPEVRLMAAEPSIPASGPVLRTAPPQTTLAADPAASPDAGAGPSRPSESAGPESLRPVSRPSPVSLASNDGFGPSRPATMEEAAQFLRETEARYLDALTAYAELASQADAGDLIARLAALQSITVTTRAALNEAPTDPVINGYHLTALAQRDATLRQVAVSASERWY